jgi:hypothetical protein
MEFVWINHRGNGRHRAGLSSRADAFAVVQPHRFNVGHGRPIRTFTRRALPLMTRRAMVPGLESLIIRSMI